MKTFMTITREGSNCYSAGIYNVPFVAGRDSPVFHSRALTSAEARELERLYHVHADSGAELHRHMFTPALGVAETEEVR